MKARQGLFQYLFVSRMTSVHHLIDLSMIIYGRGYGIPPIFETTVLRQTRMSRCRCQEKIQVRDEMSYNVSCFSSFQSTNQRIGRADASV